MFNDCDFDMQLAHLSDIFYKMNTFNTLLQSGNNNILELYDKLKAFNRNVEVWQSKMKNSNVDMFLTLKGFSERKNTSISEAVKFEF
jgi:hypothetical protein